MLLFRGCIERFVLININRPMPMTIFSFNQTLHNNFPVYLLPLNISLFNILLGCCLTIDNCQLVFKYPKDPIRSVKSSFEPFFVIEKIFQQSKPKGKILLNFQLKCLYVCETQICVTKSLPPQFAQQIINEPMKRWESRHVMHRLR